MNCLIFICPTSLYFACTFEECFCWVLNSRLVVICFSAFYRCQSIIFWLPCSWKVSCQRCCAIKSHTFFLWVLEHFLLALGTHRAAETNVWFSFLSQWSDSSTNPCYCPCQSVQSLRVWPVATPWTAARQASLSITNSRSLLKLMSIESVMPSKHLILCLPLLLLPSVFPSIRFFSNESVLRIRWPNS